VREAEIARIVSAPLSYPLCLASFIAIFFFFVLGYDVAGYGRQGGSIDGGG
jgi:hypothetical protein